ncbi:MAG: SOS response-associated peptidase [Nitrospinaceae bacterium]
MCGRYTLTQSIATLARHFRAQAEGLVHSPRHNIAPTQTLPVVMMDPSGRVLRGMRWGLVPSWAKEFPSGPGLINARAETVAEKPSFRASFKKRRCLVPADGFYEWKTGSDGKTPYLIRQPSGGLFAFAGLWSEWKQSGEPLRTYTIVTTEAHGALQPLHDRMPVLLAPEEYDSWLAPTTEPDKLRSLMAPPEATRLEWFAVSRLVNSPHNDGPECLIPAE